MHQNNLCTGMILPCTCRADVRPVCSVLFHAHIHHVGCHRRGHVPVHDMVAVQHTACFLLAKQVAPELYPYGSRGPVGAHYLAAKYNVRWGDLADDDS